MKEYERHFPMYLNNTYQTFYRLSFFMSQSKTIVTFMSMMMTITILANLPYIR